MLSVLQETQQSQSIHSHFQHRRAKTGQFCSTFYTAARAADSQFPEVIVQERCSK